MLFDMRKSLQNMMYGFFTEFLAKEAMLQSRLPHSRLRMTNLLIWGNLLMLTLILLNTLQSTAQTRELWGVTSQGGSDNKGTVFSIISDGSCYQKRLDFVGINGSDPHGGLIKSVDGNFYGLTIGGGASNLGVFYKISSNGTFTKILDLNTTTRGTNPVGNLIEASDGNFYGMGTDFSISCGAIFKITPSGTFTRLYDFTGTGPLASGCYPYGTLVEGSDGDFYGFTGDGGAFNFGTIFKITSSGSFTKLWDFNPSTDGRYARGGLVEGVDGNFYGVASSGGAFGVGTIFRISPAGTFTKLKDLNVIDGNTPYGNLTLGLDGDFYGLCSSGGTTGSGTFYKISTSGTFTKLYNFVSSSDGSAPMGTLIQESDGSFFGFCYLGGASNAGTVFRITSAGSFTKLKDFSGQPDGRRPYLNSLFASIPFTPSPVPTITSFSPAFANAGASITITGTNFDPTPANNIVKFNGAMATVMASTATSITVTVPSGGSTGLITVQVGCNTASSAANFIVPVCFPANGQNADVVLGQTNFTTNTSGSGANKFTGGGGGICIHHASGKVFVTDGANHRVLRFSALSAATTGSSAEAVLGQPDFTTITPGLSQTKMNNPGGIEIDQATGTLWVTDFLNNRVLRFDNAVSLANGAPANGVLGQPNFTTNAASVVTATTLGGPIGVALDANGDLWTAERPWNRVLKFANAASLPNGAAASVVLGQTNFTSNFAGTSQSTFNRTNGVAVDHLGNLWVADELNDRVLKFGNASSLTTGANATVVLGQTNFFGNAFATAQDRMYGPMTVHADIFGNLWVGDWANQRAIQFANAASLSNGANATRVLGSPNFTTIAGGTAQNRTGVVWAIAVDNFGNVYVGDQGNNRILRFNAPAATSTGVSICANTSTTLTATGAVALQEYRWYDVPTGGTSLSSSASFTTPTLTSPATYYLSLFDGGCSYESGRFPVAVVITPSATAPLTSSGSACGPSTPVVVNASGGTNGQYRWYTSSTGGGAITGEVNDTYTTPALTATTSYYVSINDGTCESTRTEVIAQIDTPPASPTVTGASDFPPATLTLTASGGTNGQYRWYTTATGGTALAGEVNSSYTTPSISSTTTYYVSIDNGQCESLRTPVVAGIKVNSAPVIVSTTAEVPVEGTITLSLTTLISDPEDNLDFSTLTIVSQPISGARASIEPVNNLVLDYTGISFSGPDQLTIGICDQLAACSQKELTIEVVGDITVYNAISANGDNKNPVFFLKNIDILADTKENKVTIFNRWGDIVFEVENYDNVNQVFRGLNKNGDELPSSTYYYRIEFSGGKETKTGFIALKK